LDFPNSYQISTAIDGASESRHLFYNFYIEGPENSRYRTDANDTLFAVFLRRLTRRTLDLVVNEAGLGNIPPITLVIGESRQL
jgi:hypothetical protein